MLENSIDDEPSTQILLQKYLRSIDRTGIVCGNGKTALQLLEILEFELVILDLILPDITGQEIFEIICRNSSRTTILVVTSDQTAKLENFNYMNETNHALLYKPLNKKKFIGCVKELLNTSTTMTRNQIYRD